jgi:hypothetical protein
MNNIAILPYIGLHALQIQNVKRNTAKKVSINELNSNVVLESEPKNSEAKTEEKNTTKIDDLPSDKQENVSNHLKNE